MEIGDFAFSQHSNGNLLYSTTIAQLTMDYSPKAIEYGVVDSPPSHKIPIAEFFLFLCGARQC